MKRCSNCIFLIEGRDNMCDKNPTIEETQPWDSRSEIRTYNKKCDEKNWDGKCKDHFSSMKATICIILAIFAMCLLISTFVL